MRATLPLPGTVPDPLYPHSDGKPMGESTVHISAIICLLHALEDFLPPRRRPFVAANIMLYFERGNPSACANPDVLVAFGVAAHDRLSYRVWEERVPPRVIFEVASAKDWRGDLNENRAVYAGIGVAEYFVFDPMHRRFQPPLRGFRRDRAGRSVEMVAEADGDLYSRQLRASLRVDGALLRVVDAETGAVVPTRAEAVAAERRRAEQAERERDEERLRADALAAELARLRAERGA